MPATRNDSPHDSPLYVIADVTRERPNPLPFVEAVLRAGARIIQLRAKSLSPADYRNLAIAVQQRCAAHDATFIVNDHLTIAHDLHAGLHVGQGDTDPLTARITLGNDATLGLSTHNLAQFRAARALSPPLTYIAVGPIFATATKHDADPVVGLDLLRAARAHINATTAPHTTQTKLVAIGGITLANAESVFAAGADTVAIIGDLANAPDPAAHTRALLATRARVC